VAIESNSAISAEASPSLVFVRLRASLSNALGFVKSKIAASSEKTGKFLTRSLL